LEELIITGTSVFTENPSNNPETNPTKCSLGISTGIPTEPSAEPSAEKTEEKPEIAPKDTMHISDPIMTAEEVAQDLRRSKDIEQCLKEFAMVLHKMGRSWRY
jgi:hypothetical protein